MSSLHASGHEEVGSAPDFIDEMDARFNTKLPPRPRSLPDHFASRPNTEVDLDAVRTKQRVIGVFEK
ncbi:hypothetical protein COV82_04290 [Candidatus Peregrinibacteria bacterium CG11_big_fil_rev_8_21_14_0_20_46_8]|nr:MAG: hypothetical protein COV82_04290 [Candidatus Peregrinibacteria bacterium CG11_big_fil_rev_8_21_14_0_20_46_8]